jgi:hypothetical protein
LVGRHGWGPNFESATLLLLGHGRDKGYFDRPPWALSFPVRAGESLLVVYELTVRQL